MLRRLFTVTAAAAASVASVFAGPQTYASRVQTIHAGVVLLDSSRASANAYPETAAPFPWYMLDANRSVKPVGWQFSNPHAATRVTTPIKLRWDALTGGSITLGTRLNKKTAPYWEVSLNQISDEAITDYDILLVNAKYPANMNPTERERLRKFVDHGGILWIDASQWSGQATSIYDPVNGTPLPFQVSSQAVSVPQFSDFTHPLLSRPYPLSATDLFLLNTGANQTLTYQPVDPGSSIPAFFSALTGQSQEIRPLSYISNGAYQTMGVAQMGAGYVVLTTRGASLKLNRSTGTDYGYNATRPNTGFMAFDPPTLDADGIAVAKLVVNMISMGTEFRQEGANSTKTNSSSVSLGAPLLNRVSLTGANFNVRGMAGSVLYKGMVIATSGNMIVAYDANPRTDLDQDGNEDDGIPDDLGSGLDRIWEIQVQGATTLSPPVVAEVAGSPQPDQVLVLDDAGRLHGFNPVLRDSTNGWRFVQGDRPEIYLPNPLGGGNENTPGPVLPPTSDAVSGNGVPLAPTVHDGLAFIADQITGTSERGRLWVMNLRTLRPMATGDRWYQGGGSSPFQATPFAASPTVGYIPIQDNSGGVDRVVYLPFQTDDNGSAPGFVSLWLGAKGEKPATAESLPGVGLQVTTRTYNQGGLPIYENANANDPLNVRLVLQDASGNPMPKGTMESLFKGAPVDQGGGVLLFPYRGAQEVDLNVYSPRIDYTIDWGNKSTGALPAVERGRLQAPERPSEAKREIAGPLALTPAGTLYMTLSPRSGGGVAGLFGFREEGRGLFRCNFRYELYPKYSFTAQGVGQDSQPPALADVDDLQRMIPQLRGDLTGFSIRGGASVRNGQVYITANAVKTSGVPVMILLAFQAEPETPQFRVDDLPDGSMLVQADLVRSTSPFTPDLPAVFPSANYTYDPESRTIRIENLMTIPRGQIQQCLDLSQRIYLRRPGRPDTPIDPDAQGGDARWSPLLWFAVANGFTGTTSPLITGDTLFVGGSTGVRNFVLGNGFQPEGMLLAMSSEISPNDDDLTFVPGRPWLKQVKVLSEKTRWPYLTGFENVDPTEWMKLYAQRLGQTVLPASVRVTALSGGDGALVALGDAGLYTYDRADFLVADEGRLALFDPSGEPLWSTDATYASGPDGSSGAVNARPLVRPTRAYRLGPTDMLVTDPGANRVVRIDMSGKELRAISGFRLDNTSVPLGYAANESLQLKDPRDAITYTDIVDISTTQMTRGDGEAANAYEYWVHYVIADAGNRRLLELVDRYAYDPQSGRILDPIKVNGATQFGVLVWHSPANVGGKQYAYNSISRVRVPNPTGTGTRYVYVSGVTNVLPTSSSLGITSGASLESAGGNGGVIVFDPARPGPFVFNEVLIPQILQNVLWNESTGQWDAPAVPAKVHPLTNITSVTATVEQVGTSVVGYLMITDANGVYETTFPINGTDTPSPRLGVSWLMPNEVFRVMRRTNSGAPAGSNAKVLRALYARRLNATSVVVVNGYVGQTRDGQAFKGEVVQVDGTRDDSRYGVRNFNFDNSSITYELRSIRNTRGLSMPVFADRR